MSDDTKNDSGTGATTTDSEAAGGPDPSEDSWDAIGQQLNELGGSIASMGRAIADDPDVKMHAREVKSRLEALATALGDSIDAAADSEEGRRFREHADRAAESVAAAGASAVATVRPHVAAALESANETLRSMVERMEQRSDGEGTPPGEAPEADPPPAGSDPDASDGKAAE